MHEAAIADSILKIVLQQVGKTSGGLAALAVHVVAGEFRNVDKDTLEFAFDSLKTFDQRTSRCKLELEIKTATALCRMGEHSYHPEFEQAYRCPICASGIGRLVSGEELDVVNVSVETISEGERDNYARIRK